MIGELRKYWPRIIIAACVGAIIASMIGIAQSGIIPGLGVIVVAGLGVAGAIAGGILVVFKDEETFAKRLAITFLGALGLIAAFAAVGAIFGLVWAALLHAMIGRSVWIMAVYFATLGPWAGSGVVGLAILAQRNSRWPREEDKAGISLALVGTFPTAIISLILLLISRQSVLYGLGGLVSGLVLFCVGLWMVLSISRTIRRLRDKPPVPQFPFSRDLDGYEVVIPLKTEFRFAHEPVRAESLDRFVGRTAELDTLVERILFSEGGSFLVTGYRGVGKTSFVNQVIGRLENALPWAENLLGPTRILDVQMNIARPLQPAELMHHIIRRLHERLADEGIYARLPADLRQSLSLAYDRTSVNMTRSLAETSERQLGLSEIGLGTDQLKASIKGKFMWTQSKSRNTASSYLGYDDKAAEYDLIQLSQRLSAGYETRPTILRRAWQRVRGKSPILRTRLKIVFVFDELDKLEEYTVASGDKPRPVIDDILATLKNLFTTSGISFLFVAGKDIQERWLEDLGRGDSVYESVFSYDKYLPCMWADVGEMCDRFVDWPAHTEAEPGIGASTPSFDDSTAPYYPPYAAPTSAPTPLSADDSEPIADHGSERADHTQETEDKNQGISPARVAEVIEIIARAGGAPEDEPHNAYSPENVLTLADTAEAAWAADENKRCPQCGVSISEESALCSQCGAYLQDVDFAREAFDLFKKYLAYKGRGIPRRVIRGFNEYVQWNGRRPVLAFNQNDMERFRFFAELEDLLSAEMNKPKLIGRVAEEIQGTLKDRRLLGIYYLMDWILRQGGFEFTLKDAIAASRRLSTKIAPAEEVAPGVAGDLLELLVDKYYLLEVTKNAGDVQVGDVDVRREKRYRLTPRRLMQMEGVTSFFEEEAQAFGTPIKELEQIGHYRILERAGTGGMGVVYRAWDELKGRLVAIKVLNKDLASTPQAVERFQREAQIMSGLKHPNIVQYYDVGEDDGQRYIVMDYIDGVGLNTILEYERQLDTGTVSAIAQPVMAALDYVHEQGLVRIDIKPGNIQITTAGRVCLIDFGIAKSRDGSAHSTMAGVLVGTPHYMSPEQCRGESVDGRSDIYSMGIVLYQMLTGHLPFEGRSVSDVVLAHLNDTPVPPSHFVALPADLEGIILKCLEKSSESRYQTMRELMAAWSEATASSLSIDLAPLVMKTLENVRDTEEKDRESTQVPSNRRDSESQMILVESEVPATAPIWAAPPPPAISSGQAYIQFWRDQPLADVLNAPTRHPIFLQGGKTTIGRNSENDLVLDDADVSRFHAMIIGQEGRYFIEDLNSANGTLLNGHRIQGRQPLNDQDKIRIADFIMEFGMGRPGLVH